MAGRSDSAHVEDPPPQVAGGRPCFLIIEGRYYDDIADMLLEGAVAELEAQGATYERVTVPGALEIPQVLALVAAQGFMAAGTTGGAAGPDTTYAGAIALGCVIRGETSHYDIVCNNANHWMMEVAIRSAFPVGNAILTVDTRAQAIARAEGGRKGKGGDAARAALALYRLGFRLDAAAIEA